MQQGLFELRKFAMEADKFMSMKKGGKTPENGTSKNRKKKKFVNVQKNDAGAHPKEKKQRGRKKDGEKRRVVFRTIEPSFRHGKTEQQPRERDRSRVVRSFELTRRKKRSGEK